MPEPKLKLFSLSSNEPLAEKIAESVGVPLSEYLSSALPTVKYRLTLRKAFVGITSLLSNQPLPQSTIT